MNWMRPSLPESLQLANEEELSTVDCRLHHHVVLACRVRSLDDLIALLHRSRGRNCTSNMLTGLKRCDALRSMQMNWRVDMNCINVRILNELLEICKTLTDLILVADFV